MAKRAMMFSLTALCTLLVPCATLVGQSPSYAGVYAGQTNDVASGSPSGFALFVDANQNAVLIGGFRYNNDNGSAIYASCLVDTNGNGQSDTNGLTTSFTIHADGLVNVTAIADIGSSDYPWSYQMSGQLVTIGPFQAVSGLYGGTAGAATLQGIVAPDGAVYLFTGHSGGSMGKVAAYGQPATFASLGHMVPTVTLSSDATISAITTNLSNGSQASFSMSRIGAAVVPPTPPLIRGVALSHGSLTLEATNGVAGAKYFVLSSTNLSVPVKQWSQIATNILAADGSFTITVTNALSSAIPKRFFTIQTQ